LQPDVVTFRKPYREIDHSVVNFYSITKEQALNSVEVERLTVEDHVKNKCELALKLISEGVFKEVATVTCSDHVQAYKLVSNINGRWYTTPNKNIKLAGEASRTTTTDDIIVIEGVPHIISAFGFLNVETSEYFIVKK